MPTILDENTVRRLAQQHLKPNVCEWWLLQQYGDTDKAIPPDLSCRRLASRLGVHFATLSRNIRQAQVTMGEVLREEASKPSIPLVYVRQTPPDQVSYKRTLAQGHRTRTVTDKTQKRALRGVVRG